jgi:hypothetical protein
MGLVLIFCDCLITHAVYCLVLQVYFQVLGERGFQRQDNWNLYDLSIYLGRHREAGAQSVVERLEDSMMIYLSGFLPRVRSLKGRGNVWPICKLFRGQLYT